MTTVDVICYKYKPLKTGELPLKIKVCKDRKTRYINLGVSTKAEYWDFEKNQPKSTCPDRELLEKLISSKISEVKSKHNSPSLFSNLSDMLNQSHPLYQLADKIAWEKFETAFQPLYCQDNGRPGKPIRLMCGLLMEKPRDFDPFGQAGLSPLAII